MKSGGLQAFLQVCKNTYLMCPADPIRVHVLCGDFEKVWKLPEASRTSPRVFSRVVHRKDPRTIVRPGEVSIFREIEVFEDF